jgi:hypothetical protein
MNPLLKKILIFVIPIILVVVFLEYNLYKIPNTYSFKKDLAIKKADSTQILILGPSYTLMGINPELLKYPALNLADNAQSTYYDYMILERNLKTMKNLKVVIIPVSYFSFGYSMSMETEYWRKFFYEKFYTIPPEDNKNMLDIKRFSTFYLYGQATSLHYASKMFKVNLLGSMDQNGFEPGDPATIVEADIKDAGQYDTSLIDSKNYAKNIGYLSQMIEDVKKANVIPVLITMPCPPTYTNYINKDYYNFMQDTVKNIAKKYDIKYFNYLSDKRFTNGDFFDGSHLDVNGAEKFSKILNKEVIY